MYRQVTCNNARRKKKYVDFNQCIDGGLYSMSIGGPDAHALRVGRRRSHIYVDGTACIIIREACGIGVMQLSKKSQSADILNFEHDQ